MFKEAASNRVVVHPHQLETPLTVGEILAAGIQVNLF